jgi:hypothetical protein
MLKRHTLPSQDELNDLFVYDELSGWLYWKPRSLEMFQDSRSWKIWNTRYAGKQAGCRDADGAIVISLRGKTEFAHRLIWKMKTSQEPSYIDHRDLDPSNNRFSNLRTAQHSQNLFNVAGHKNTISGLKGVHFNKRCLKKPWNAVVGKGGKNYGTYILDSLAIFD